MCCTVQHVIMKVLNPLSAPEESGFGMVFGIVCTCMFVYEISVWMFFCLGNQLFVHVCACHSTCICSSGVHYVCMRVLGRIWPRPRPGNVADTKGRQPLFLLVQQSAWHPSYHQSNGGLAGGKPNGALHGL